MPLTILNRQRAFKISKKAAQPLFDAMLDAAGIAEREITLVFTSDRGIRELNRTYRHVNEATDCLSFVAGEGEDGQLAGPVLGDIVISLQSALAQGREYAPEDVSDEEVLLSEVVLLFTHSLMHLLGHDHDTPAKEKKMKAAEQELLTTVGLIGDDACSDHDCHTCGHGCCD